MPRACHFDQAHARVADHLGGQGIGGNGFLKGVEHAAPVVGVPDRHEIDDDEAAEIAEPDLPGRFLGRYLPHRYGKIEPGFVGSLTVLKKESFTVRRAELKTRAGWSPFEGVTFPGRASHTIVRGQIYPRLD